MTRSSNTLPRHEAGQPRARENDPPGDQEGAGSSRLLRKVTGSQGPVDLGRAAELTTHTAKQLVKLLERRHHQIDNSGKARPSDIPEPVGYDPDDDPVWSYEEFRLWALRMGVWAEGWKGQPAIGILGIAAMLGLEEQSIRKLHSLRLKHIDERGEADPEDIPGSIDELQWDSQLIVLLFNTEEIRTWAIRTGRLRSDGVTPNLLRPRRGTRRNA